MLIINKKCNCQWLLFFVEYDNFAVGWILVSAISIIKEEIIKGR